MTASNDLQSTTSGKSSARPMTVEPSPKRVRVMFNGTTVADTLRAGLLLEAGHMPVYYFPREDVRMDLLERTDHCTHCPYKGDASYWTVTVGNGRAENAVWSYEEPLPEMARLKDYLAFYWDKVHHWFEEDEEVFGHARDPHHRIDIRPSSREIRAILGGETIAQTRRGMFLFETGLPTRYYIPPQDVRMEFLTPSRRTSVCPYKGTASYWSVRVGDRISEDAVWGYPEPLPECPRIRGHFCFYPEKIDRLDVEGETRSG
jgi:uncharacterized protein (DUF427 family)